MASLYLLLVPLFGFIVFDQFRKLSRSVRHKNNNDILTHAIFLTLLMVICVMLIMLIQGLTG